MGWLKKSFVLYVRLHSKAGGRVDPGCDLWFGQTGHLWIQKILSKTLFTFTSNILNNRERCLGGQGFRDF